MIVSINFTRRFEIQFKRYKKKFSSLQSDLKLFTDSLPEVNAVNLGGGLRKCRLPVKSKNKGKSGGFRVIYFEVLIAVDHQNITLLFIYDKSERSSITKKEIDDILKDEGLI